MNDLNGLQSVRALARLLLDQIGDSSLFDITYVSGGHINDNYCVASAQCRYFLKLNQRKSVLQAEYQALYWFNDNLDIEYPTPLVLGDLGAVWGLLLEYRNLRSLDIRTAPEAGAALAEQHRVTNEQFGWSCTNHIGNTIQKNVWSDDWLVFWRDNRLSNQLQLAEANGARKQLLDLGQQLLGKLEVILADYKPQASLLHGDLWSGNIAIDTDSGAPFFFDPAVYFGDRETDLAMTELFGRFPQGFYQAYNESWPLDAGYEQRKELYQLYHILNHFNLFGGSYEAQSLHMMQRLVDC